MSLIEREAACLVCSKYFDSGGCSGDDVAMDIQSDLLGLPSAQTERKTGKWIKDNGDWFETMFRCSECGALIQKQEKFRSFFCYHCGTDMREEKQNERLNRRQAAIDAVHRNYDPILDFKSDGKTVANSVEDILSELPSAQPTLYGYNIEHLELIARVLQKEDLPPERVVEALTDIGRIVAIVRDEFEEMLRRAVEVRAEDDFCSAAERRTDEQDD